MVARPPRPAAAGAPVIPDNTRWAIYHRRTGRELATGLRSGNRNDWLQLHARILEVTPGRFWSAFMTAQLGDPFVFPPELIAKAMAGVAPAWQSEVLAEARKLRDAAEALERRLRGPGLRSPIAREHVAKVRQLRQYVERANASL